jgi:predicted Zn-dependent protease
VQVVREVRKASDLIDQREFEQALKTTDALLEKHPQMPDLWMVRSDSLAALGAVPEALDAAKRGLTLNPASHLLAIRVADLSVRMNDLAGGRQHAELVLARMPAEAHGVLARAALAEQNFDLAEREARLSMQSDPSRPSVHALVGRILLQKKNAAGALSEFDKALALAAKNKRGVRFVQLQRGVALRQLNRGKDAEAAFLEEMRLFPDEPEAFWNLLVMYIEQNQRAEAAKLIDFLVMKRNSPTSYSLIADAFLATRRITAAQQVANEGLKKYPNDPNLQKLKAGLAQLAAKPQARFE